MQPSNDMLIRVVCQLHHSSDQLSPPQRSFVVLFRAFIVNSECHRHCSSRLSHQHRWRWRPGWIVSACRGETLKLAVPLPDAQKRLSDGHHSFGILWPSAHEILWVPSACSRGRVLLASVFGRRFLCHAAISVAIHPSLPRKDCARGGCEGQEMPSDLRRHCMAKPLGEEWH